MMRYLDVDSGDGDPSMELFNYPKCACNMSSDYFIPFGCLVPCHWPTPPVDSSRHSRVTGLTKDPWTGLSTSRVQHMLPRGVYLSVYMFLRGLCLSVCMSLLMYVSPCVCPSVRMTLHVHVRPCIEKGW